MALRVQVAASNRDSDGDTSPIRILFVDHTATMGGGEIALLKLVRHLDPRHYTPLVLLFSDGPLAARLRQSAVAVQILPLSPRIGRTRKGTLGVRVLLRVEDGVQLLAFILRVARFVRAGRYPLVHTNSLKSDIIGGLAARLSGAKVIWHVRDRICEDYLPPAAVTAFRFLCRLVPNFIIANSRSTWETLGSGMVGTHIPSGVEIPKPLPVPGDPSHLQAPGGPAAPPRYHRVGLVGRLSPWKGQHVFIRAAQAVLREFPHTHFQIIGSALFDEHAYASDLRQLARNLGLAQAIEFTGFRTDVPQLIGALDVLVHASITGEPFGQVVIEGMAAGKPIVATNGGGIPEIVLDGQTGLLIPMNDPAAMADAIVQLLRDPALAGRLGARGREHVAEHFTIERTAQRVQQVYDQLLK